ncbi:MAG: DPP IV N-terminal domain-containing protein, partial [Bacteroidaceae bacterium]|nr:DPP IV N-terminal domain-containing protein [Bacteroidaceae bacterium]
MKKNTFILTFCLCCMALGLQVQHIPTLEEAVYGGLVKTEGGGYVNWMKDGEHYSKIERNADGGFDVMAYSAKDNSKEVLIPANKLVNPKTGKPIRVRSFAFSDDNNKVLIYTNTRQVWRYDTRGDYWVLDIQSGKLQQLGKDRPEATLMFAKFSPDGSRVAYVSENNIYVETLADGKVVQLTQDGNEKIVNGTFDWVYEEEFDCRDGFRWSPDSKYIAYWQSDTNGTGWFDIINNVDSIYPTIHRFPYPKAGTTNSAVKVGYVSADGGKTTWIVMPGDPRNSYIPRMEFIPDSNELFIQQMNREQNTNRVWTIKIDESFPVLVPILIESDKAWVETNDDIHWLKGNKYFTWKSEQSGYRHLYRVSRDGKEMIPITKGNFDFISEVGMDMEKGLVYFIATPENFTQRYLYQAKLFGKGEVKRLSPMDQSGQHSYNMSPSGKWAVHTFSNAQTPPVIDMVSFPNHKSVRMITDNAKAKEQFDALGLQPKEFFKVQSENWTLDGWMIKPVNFDANKKYPVILDIYGEPAASTVQDSWSGSMWHQYLANLGYIVVSIDNRGANVPRGREWRKCIYGEIDTINSLD